MSNIDKYTKFMSEQAKTASTGLFGTHKNGFVTEAEQPIAESKTYSMDYDGEKEDTKGAKALDNAHHHFKKHGYTISHEGSDDPSHKERKNADITYHYAMGDDMHHAFTIHKGGKAANDSKIKALIKHLEDVTN